MAYLVGLLLVVSPILPVIIAVILGLYLKFKGKLSDYLSILGVSILIVLVVNLIYEYAWYLISLQRNIKLDAFNFPGLFLVVAIQGFIAWIITIMVQALYEGFKRGRENS